MTDGDFNQAFQSFARRENLPAALTSEEWSSVPSEIRERAFFMSRVTDAEILQRFRTGVEDVLAGRKGLTTVEKELDMWLDARGYKPPEGKAGGLQDLSSLPRIMVVLRTNMDMARGHAAWVRMQTGIRAFPARRFYRLSKREVPRDWETRWKEAKEATKETPGVHPTEKVALTNHPIWTELSRFAQPWAPYDWGSGMGDEPVSRTDAKALGLPLNPKDPSQTPRHQSMNDGLEASPEISDPVLRDALADKLGRFGQWDGEKIVFTDPDGTKPFTAPQLAGIWKKPAPKGYNKITQRDALKKWDGGNSPEIAETRMILRRLFDRIETPEPPEEVFRAFPLSAADAAAMVRGLAAKQFRIPPNVSGWEFGKNATDALKAISTPAKGWRVILRVKGSNKVVDVQALRPGKPGFVVVGGTEFKVSNFRQDPKARLILIELSDA